MFDHAFTESDKAKVIEFLNFIATKAVFPDWKTEDTVAHFKLLAHMQQVILPKIDAHILELGKVVEVDTPKEEKAKRK